MACLIIFHETIVTDLRISYYNLIGLPIKLASLFLICFHYLSFVVIYFFCLCFFLFIFYYITISDYYLNALAESWSAKP